MTNHIVSTPEWKKKLLRGELDLRKETYALQISFKPVWMQRKVRVVLSLVSVKDGHVAGQWESEPLGVDAKLTLTDLRSVFNITMTA